MILSPTGIDINISMKAKYYSLTHLFTAISRKRQTYILESSFLNLRTVAQ